MLTNEFIRSLPVSTRTIGHMADGTAITVEVHTMFPEESAK